MWWQGRFTEMPWLKLYNNPMTLQERTDMSRLTTRRNPNPKNDFFPIRVRSSKVITSGKMHRLENIITQKNGVLSF